MQFAGLMEERNKPEEALGLSEQAIKIYEAIAPGDALAAAPPHVFHAHALAMLGHSREAFTEYQAALPVLVNAWGLTSLAMRSDTVLIDRASACRSSTGPSN